MHPASHLVMVMVRLRYQVPVLVCLGVEGAPVTLLLPVNCVCVLLAAGKDGPLGGFDRCAVRLPSRSAHV
jgi:hypothetical protein